MKQVLPLALAVSLGAALGAGFATVAVRGAPASSEGSGSGESLAKTVGDLAAAVRSLEERLAAIPIPAVPEEATRAVAKSPSGPAEDLARTMRDLTGRLDLLQAAMAERFSGQPPLALQTARTPDVPALEDARSRTMSERSRDHAMWTFREVLARYGRPDDVDVQSGETPKICWTYALPGNRLVRFKFIEGYAIWVSDERAPF